MCDLCEKEPVELFFRAYEDRENFLNYGTLPNNDLTLLFGGLKTRGGKAFHLWLTGVTIVLCDKCLAKNQDTTLVYLSKKPRIIQEALQNVNRAIAEKGKRLSELKSELELLQKQILEKTNELQKYKTYLFTDKEKKAELTEKMKEIDTARKQVIALLQKMANRGSAS